MYLTVCYNVTYALQSESTLYCCLNIKELLAQNRCKIWCLIDCSLSRTESLLVRQRTLNHLAKLAKWLTFVVSWNLYGTFDCMFILCHVCFSELIYTLELPECQGTPCSKQVQNLTLNPIRPGLLGGIKSRRRVWGIQKTTSLKTFLWLWKCFEIWFE